MLATVLLWLPSSSPWLPFEFVSLCTLAVSIISFCIASDPHYRLECLEVRCPEKKWVETETFYVRDNSVNPGPTLTHFTLKKVVSEPPYNN